MEAEANTFQSNEDIFPAYNVHSFIFSNPFTSSSPLVSKVNGLTGLENATFPPTPPHKPIFYDPISSAAITHTRLKRDTLRLAHGIHQRFGIPHVTDTSGNGSRVGPVVLVHLSNSLVWPVILLGFIAAGWTVTATNPAYTPSELAHVIELCGPQVVICYPGTGGEDSIRAACEAVRYKKLYYMLVDPDEDAYGVKNRVPGEHSWTSLLSNKELEVSPLAADDVDRRVALLMWTSGTTGKPKGAMMTHRAIIAGLTMLWTMNVYLPDERWLTVAPFFHVFSLYMNVLLAPCIGATAIVVTKFDLEQYLRLATAYKVTHLHIAPPIAVALAKSSLLDEPWCSLDSVVGAIAGGAPVPPETIREVQKRTGIVVKDGYGMTELGPIASSKSSRWEDVEPHLGSVGPPAFGIKTTILGENKKPVDGKTQGEIVLRSPAQMLGYLKNSRATAETLDENGVHTGDIGYIDEAGNIRITGRSKELIKYKGFQVSPTELEAVITGLPEVQDVAVSSVYSNVEGTELPLAYVIPREPAELRLVTSAVKAGTRPKELVALAEKVKMIIENKCVHYKRLRGGVTIVLTIPKSSSGKILRSALKDQQGVHVQCYPTSMPSRL